ncbi:MAG TPA: hypothetical protein DEV81_10090 [Cyanobacteria bacterium UBA11049]|nr:hypothetical protein [Cyanobacteria bacterium UBA11049]
MRCLFPARSPTLVLGSLRCRLQSKDSIAFHSDSIGLKVLLDFALACFHQQSLTVSKTFHKTITFYQL